MNIQTEAVILAEDVIVNTANNNPSLINIFNQITAKKFPAVHGKMVVLADLVMPDQEIYKVSIKITTSNSDKIVFESPQKEVRAKGETNLVRIINTLRGLTFSEKGSYQVGIYVNDALVGIRRLFLRTTE